MGYCITASGDLYLKAEDAPRALEAAKAIFKPEVLHANANGGSFGPGGVAREVWYSWISTPEALAASTLAEMLGVWRYNVQNPDATPDERGFLQWDIYFDGEKLGQEDHLFAAIAPFITSGDIYAQGEDGSSWRWHFAGGKVVEQMGTVTYE